MAQQELLEFIQKQQAAGKSEADIRALATQKGWAVEDVNGALASLFVYQKAISQGRTPVLEGRKQQKTHHLANILILFVIFLAPATVYGLHIALPFLDFGSLFSGSSQATTTNATPKIPYDYSVTFGPAPHQAVSPTYTHAINTFSPPQVTDTSLLHATYIPNTVSTPPTFSQTVSQIVTTITGNTYGNNPSPTQTTTTTTVPPATTSSQPATTTSTQGSSGGGSSGGSTQTTSGSGTSTSTPPAPTSSTGSDEMTMAAFDAVPYDIVESPRNIGVLAYHISGVQQVNFSVNGGPAIVVSGRSLNSETNVPEYFFRLDPTAYPDGPLTITADAIPNTGLTHHLSLQLYNNAAHSLARPVAYVSPSGSDTTGDGSQANPYASIVKAGESFSDPNGAIIYMLPGDYAFTHFVWSDNIGNKLAFITLTPAPGVTRDQVRIASGIDGGIASTLVHVKNITLVPNALQGNYTTRATNVVWIEGSKLTGTYAQNQVWDPWTVNYQTYATDSEIDNTDWGIQGVLERNDHYQNSYSQGISADTTALNVTIDTIDRQQFTSVHPDVDHFYGTDPVQQSTGMIRYGVVATNHIVARGFAVMDLNVVYDNCQVNTTYPLYALSMGGIVTGTDRLVQNVLFYDTTITGGAIWNESGNTYNLHAKDILFQNTKINGNPTLAPTQYGPFSGVYVR